MHRLALLALVLLSQAALLRADEVRAPVDVSPAVAVGGAFTILSYHEVRGVRDYPDPFAVNPLELVRQFGWLRGNGYTPVSLDQVVAARRGGKPLPAKAVLLSFDDGYLSFYTRVYPLLKEFRYPAVLGVVGRWIDNPKMVPPLVDDQGAVVRESLARWRQFREMSESGLVEIASHTYDLHHGVAANPQGNLQPAATTRLFDAATGRYEDDAAWRKRVSADLAAGAAAIEHGTGRRPRTVVWPYGSYNDELVGMAARQGMVIALTLDDGMNTPDVPLAALRRTLIEHNPALAEFVSEGRGPLYAEPLRALQVSLDDIFNAEPARQEGNLSLLLERVDMLKPTHVYLQGTGDTDRDGFADVAYFPNRHLPLRADLFNRVAWQLASRIDLKVYALLPVSGFRLPRAAIAEVYEDLARHAPFDGLVFDDGLLSGAAPDAATRGFTHELATRVRAFRAPVKTVGTLVAPASRGAGREFADYLASYDLVSIVTTTGRDEAADPGTWLGPAAADPAVRRRILFMLREDKAGRTFDASAGGNAIAARMRALQLGGWLNFGFGPDDFLHDDPPLTGVSPHMSLRVDPAGPGKVAR
jgi:biofilm PGA synthesis lipoprotein PgaB